MYRLLFWNFIFLILFSAYCNGQTIEWQRACGGNNDDYFYGVATDTLGFIYVVGSSATENNGDLPLSCSTTSAAQNPWVYKCDSLGNLQWSKCLGIDGRIYDIVRSDHNTFYITGWLCDGGQPGCDLWYAEMDTTGTVGAISFISGGPNEEEYGYSVGKSSIHNLVAVGMTNTALAHGDFDLYFLASDSNGALVQWYGGSNFDVGSYIHELSNGNLLIVGTTFSTDGDITSTHGNGDAWVLEIDQMGNIIWQKTYGGSDWDNAYSFLELPNGLIAIVGTTESADGDILSNHSNDNDAWLFIIDSIGNLQNSWTYGGTFTETFNKVFFNSVTGNFTVIGLAGSLDGDVVFNHNPNGGNEIWHVIIDSTGSIISSSTFGGFGFDTPYSAVTTDDDIIIVGSTNTNNNGDVSNYHFSAVYPDDGWVLRINNFTTNIKAFTSTEIIKVFPNPVHDKMKFIMPSAQQSQRIEIHIYDLFGKVVLSQNEFIRSEELDVSSLSSGCYIISVLINNQSHLFKLIKL